METLTGQLFDLGTDGLGFIAETGTERIWAFQFPLSGRSLAPDPKAFVLLDGEKVRFRLEGNRVGSIDLIAATASK